MCSGRAPTSWALTSLWGATISITLPIHSLFVACCALLFPVCSLLFVVSFLFYLVCCFLFLICCVLCVVCCLVFVISCLLSAACCLLPVVCCLLFVVCCLSFVVCRLLFVVRCLLLVFAVCRLLFFCCRLCVVAGGRCRLLVLVICCCFLFVVTPAFLGRRNINLPGSTPRPNQFSQFLMWVLRFCQFPFSAGMSILSFGSVSFLQVLYICDSFYIPLGIYSIPLLQEKSRVVKTIGRRCPAAALQSVTSLRLFPSSEESAPPRSHPHPRDILVLLPFMFRQEISEPRKIAQAPL